MGVKSLWAILAPTSRAVRQETLAHKILAIDASIWLYQFLKAMRDGEGNMMEAAHILGFFRRICKLLYWGVRPVFVFDGAAPPLKQATMAERRRRKDESEQDVNRTAQQLVSAQLQIAAMESQGSSQGSRGFPVRPPNKKAQAKDPYSLPSIGEWKNIVASRASQGQGEGREDVRMPALRSEMDDTKEEDEDEELRFIRSLSMLIASNSQSGRNSNMTAEPPGEYESMMAAERFNQLPLQIQHEIVQQLKDRSRQQSHRRLARMIRNSPSALDFSKLQIKNLMTRNYLTQKLHQVSGFGAGTPGDPKLAVKRVASDRRRQYVFVKNADGTGWKFEAVEPSGQQLQEQVAVESSNDHIHVIAHGAKPAFPLVGAERVLHGDESDSDNEWAGSMRNGDDDEDDFEPVAVGVLPPELQEVQDLIPRSFDQTFSLGTEMLHSALGWSTPELKAALADCQHRLDKMKAELRLPGKVTDYENFVFWEDYLDKLVLRREELDARFAKSRKIMQQEGNLNQGFWHGRVEALYENDPKETAGTPVSSSPVPCIFEPVEGNFEATSRIMSSNSIPRTDLFRNVLHGDSQSPPQTNTTTYTQAATQADANKLYVLPQGENTRSHTEARAPGNSAILLQPALGKPAKANRSFFEESSDSDDNDVVPYLPSKGSKAVSGGLASKPQKTHVSTVNQSLAASSSRQDGDCAQNPLHDSLATCWQETKCVAPESVTVQASKAVNKVHLPEVAVTETSSDGDDAGFEVVRVNSLSAPPKAPEETDTSSSTQTTMYVASQGDAIEAIMATRKEEDEQFAQFFSHLQQEGSGALDRSMEHLRQEEEKLQARIKQGKRDTETVTEEMVAETQKLLQLFGIPYVTAPFEAEAQCAWFSSEGFVDGVVTDDSDVFLFGGQVVYKNMFNNAKYVEAYTARDIQHNLQLDQDQMIALAQLLGSDYAPGLSGCGAVTAMEILAEFPGGCTVGLREFANWACDGALIDEQGNSTVRRRLRKVAQEVPRSNFPDSRVEVAYRNPSIDDSREPFSWGHPDLEALKAFLWDHLQWAPHLADTTLGPIIAALNRYRADAVNRQSSLLDYFAVTESRKRTKGITSVRMQKAIESKRRQREGPASDLLMEAPPRKRTREDATRLLQRAALAGPKPES